MAHVGIVTAAYWGDVMPFLPIADELVARGHRVTLAVPEGFHDILHDHPVELVHLGTDFSPRELAAHGDVMERANSMRGIRQALDLWIRQLTIEPAERILAVLDDIAPDVWISHNTCAWLVELSAAPTGTPLVVGHLFPMMIPSEHQAPPLLPIPGMRSRTVRRAGWRLGRHLMARMSYDDEVNALRATRGLPPAHANVGLGWLRADRVLLLSSDRYWPRPPDWPDVVRTTGFTVWGSVDDPLPPDLAAYLDAGDPPVLVTLGTSAASNARDAFALAAEAVDAAAHRPLLLVGNDRNRALLGDRDDTWTFAPIRPVLARCRAVVHAAGHGTTAAAMHAGIPQVLLPQGFDQVVHAQRVADLGLGVVVPWRRRSVERLAAALEQATDTEVVRRAEAFARELAGEDGPASAADEVEATLSAARS